MRYAMLLLVLGLSVSVVLVGCGGDDAAGVNVTDAERSAKTPEDAVRASLLAFVTAINEGKIEQASARMDIPEGLKSFIAAAMKASAISETFQKKAIDAYGEDIVARLNINDMSGSGPFSKDENFKAKIEATKVVVTGDTAAVTHEDEDGPLTMKKIDGVWKLSMSPKELEGINSMPPETMSMMATGMEGTAEVMQQMEPKIGNMSRDEFVTAYKKATEENPKVKKMAEAMGAIMMKAMQDAMQDQE